MAHWKDTATVVSLFAAVLLLAVFVLVERRSPNPLVPLRIFASRNRCGAYLIVLCVVTAMFGIFFFLTIFFQTVWGYSALKSGAAYLPMAVSLIALVVDTGPGRFWSIGLVTLGCFVIGPFSCGLWMVFGQQLEIWLKRTGTERYLGAVLAVLMVLAVILFLL